MQQINHLFQMSSYFIFFFYRYIGITVHDGTLAFWILACYWALYCGSHLQSNIPRIFKSLLVSPIHWLLRWPPLFTPSILNSWYNLLNPKHHMSKPLQSATLVNLSVSYLARIPLYPSLNRFSILFLNIIASKILIIFHSKNSFLLSPCMRVDVMCPCLA